VDNPQRVNDNDQDDITDITAFYNIENPGERTANGNGAVRFVIAPRTPDDGSKLEITDGVFAGP
jgi:hypothetical protein